MTARRRPVRVVAEPDATTGRAPRRQHTATRSRPAAEAAAPAQVTVGERDRVLLLPELSAFVAGLGASPARAEYEAAVAGVEAGEVSGVGLERLSTFLEVGLASGRLKGRLGQHAEDSLRRLFERTPRGAALAQSAAEVSRALGELVGQPLGAIALRLARPGEYRLEIEAGQYRLAVALAPSGARVESVELDL